MQTKSSILIHNLQYITNNAHEIFSELNLTFTQKKYGIVGKNGCGKSTLLKLIIGELAPTCGQVLTNATIGYCPQEFTLECNKNVAEFLCVAAKLQALERIQAGSIAAIDFETLADDWQILERSQKLLEKFGLANLTLSYSLKNLSGGELTQIYLAKTFFADKDFIILDEPTNNLDSSAKQKLFAQIQDWQKGLIVVSHDRELLELMSEIVALNSHGAEIYGGNYSFYKEQSALQKQAKLQQYEFAKHELKKTKLHLQKTQEKQQKRCQKGKALRHTGSQSKLILNAMRENSEQNQKRESIRSARMLEQSTTNLDNARKNIEIDEEINFILKDAQIPPGKIVIEMHDVTFSYANSATLIHNFNLRILGRERVAVLGKNGSGKTTLVKIILGIIKPDAGSVFIGIDNMRYLDQTASLLDLNLTVLDNFKKFNPHINETQARTLLAAFLFRNEKALQLAGNLSGGEKIRALLAAVLMAEKPAQLIILDEPTNNLDLDSIYSLEKALNCYHGALLVISHDQKFLENISVTKYFAL
ncbi:MAG: ATP-binding cassette domain-containing protein [Gammaproteobacteria bacterium]|nr:ATP-binding cassette domain-containing protein [Gammaproteobacteria bacterium]